MAQYPTDLRYTKDHEWARIEGDLVRIGVTAYAVEQLGDVTLVELPGVSTEVEAHGKFGDIESVKTVSELFSPVSGEVVEVNGELEDAPELVNESPYDKGWMVVVKISEPSELGELMDSAAYEAFLGTLD
ncbi:MAG: glycine cleavage system protein GcvH [Sandaracinus sp.]|nr:glycine cleavage system protein GcvH [Myxococcales bacterium]MCB9617296.1 glycine cleavage system protein GcvH [Sandaracinus sp.]